MKVSIVSYDVWGNAKDGYEVNDSYYVVRDVEFDGDWDNDRDLVKFLKEQDYLAKHVKVSNLEVDGDEFCAYINRKKDSYPICEIRNESI